ncbi:hypothetical protein CARUB_v10025522mg [Capsella rubella]|uniref:NAB domain-containing protein n=1 Tax=Capsella rubella TaxID=81985 RepID=R0HYS6_9BRAS|nr:protein NETWORKED 3C [Capsella rubella]EOA29248.1 hypothetical protein CARUB_v10025522mg [Capsella rubella]
MVREEEKSKWWWFESHPKSSKHSQWLHSTLSELDAKTKSMLMLIEGNADSFAQRAEAYYKKRPELVSFVEDFYRSHRSLAERFDHLRSSDHPSRSSKLPQESVSDSNSLFEFEDADSEIEDPDHEEHDSSSKFDQETLKLIHESDALRKQLLSKDEEKREVIRQLSLTLEALKDENSRLKRLLGLHSLKKPTVSHVNFFGKLFYTMCDANNKVV